MKKLLLFGVIFWGLNSHGQNLKTYTGEMQDAISDKGKVTYSYYEKDGEIIRHGNFSYAWKDQQTVSIRYKKINVLLSKSIKGKYKDGLKDGKWTYIVKYVDYPLNDNHDEIGISGADTYSTGAISMTANYKKGVPHGNWSYARNYKTRYVEYHSLNWSTTSSITKVTLQASFNEGTMVGAFNYNNPFLEESSRFTLNNEGVLIGKGEYVNLGSSTELTFNGGIKIKEVQRNMSSAKMDVKTDVSEKLADPNFEYKLDTSDINTHLDDLLDVFRQNRFFNYSHILDNSVELIGGDFFKSKRVKGGIFYTVFKCASFDKSEATGWVRHKEGHWSKYRGTDYYSIAKKALEDGELSNALENFEMVKYYLGDDSWVCRDERAQYLKKTERYIEIVDSLIPIAIERAKREDYERAISDGDKSVEKKDFMAANDYYSYAEKLYPDEDLSNKFIEANKQEVKHKKEQEVRVLYTKLIELEPRFTSLYIVQTQTDLLGAIEVYPNGGKKFYEKVSNLFLEIRAGLESDNLDVQLEAVKTAVKMLEALIDLNKKVTKELKKEMKKAKSTEEILKVLGV